MSWQNEARSRSANAVFHKHKDLVDKGFDGGDAALAAGVPPSYMLQQPMQMAVHMPPMGAHMPGQMPPPMPMPMPPHMMPLPPYPPGSLMPMSMPPGFDGEMGQKHALPMKVDGYFNLEPILYQVGE